MLRRQSLSGLDRGGSQEFSSALSEARTELIAGFKQKQARIAPKYFYNALGSKLFEAICLLDEYYPTRVEAGIFAAHAPQIAQAAGSGTTLIDLGAGNCAKAEGLFGVLKPQQYVAVDISAEFLHAAVRRLQRDYPHIPMTGVGLDFADTLALPAQVKRERRLFFYPGSSIGNFAPLQAAQFLKRVRAACQPADRASADGAILIGVDLVKQADLLEAAYDDAIGVTAAFNLNALRHVNQIVESDFDLRSWRHRALFNAEQSRIEMHLEARHDLRVTWPGGGRDFAAGERIHTENSYKYTRRAFAELLEQAGFGHASCWTDPDNSFLVCHARAV
jgi:L-histidine Nalpha-methyltransferase